MVPVDVAPEVLAPLGEHGMQLAPVDVERDQHGGVGPHPSTDACEPGGFGPRLQ